MGRKIVTLLFSKDKNSEPEAILQCDTSGEYLPFYFFDWRDSIHYIQWCLNNNLSSADIKSFEQWGKKYGYNDKEEFNGNLNEFRCDENDNDNDEWVVFTTIGDIDGSKNLKKLSAWK